MPINDTGYKPQRYGTGNDQRFQRSIRSNKRHMASQTFRERWGESASDEITLRAVAWPREVKAWINVYCQHFPALALTKPPSVYRPRCEQWPCGSHIEKYQFHDFRGYHDAIEERKEYGTWSCYQMYNFQTVEEYVNKYFDQDENCVVEQPIIRRGQPRVEDFTFTCSGERNKKGEAQLEAAIKIVDWIIYLDMLHEIARLPDELDTARIKLDRKLMGETCPDFTEKEAKRKMQDLCKFLCVPINFQNRMLGAQAVTDKTAKCELQLAMPQARRRNGKDHSTERFPIFKAEASAKGEQEAIQKCSESMVKKLVDSNWLLSKSDSVNDPDINLKFLRNFFSGSIRPAKKDTFNIYGGHTESSAPGRLSALTTQLEILDPTMINDRIDDTEESWLFNSAINLRFVAKDVNTVRKSTIAPHKPVQDSTNFWKPGPDGSYEIVNLWGKGIAERKEHAQHRAILEVMRQLYQKWFVEPEFSVLHDDKQFVPQMSGYDKKRFCDVFLNCGKMYLPDSFYHFTTNCRKNTKKLMNKNGFIDHMAVNFNACFVNVVWEIENSPNFPKKCGRLAPLRFARHGRIFSCLLVLEVTQFKKKILFFSLFFLFFSLFSLFFPFFSLFLFFF